MHKRIAPQEILKPNEEVEVDPEEEASEPEIPMAVEESDKSSDDDGDDDDQIRSGKPAAAETKAQTIIEEQDDGSFNEVKLASKYAAFVKKNSKGLSFIISST